MRKRVACLMMGLAMASSLLAGCASNSKTKDGKDSAGSSWRLFQRVTVFL